MDGLGARLRTGVLALACGFIGSSLGPAAAEAQTRSGAGSDPRDVPEALSGGRQPDIEQVRVVYDPAGTLSVTVRLYEPFASTNGAYPYFETTIGSAVASYSRGCSPSNSGDVTLNGSISSSPWATVRMSGYDGSLSPTRSMSGAGREITFAVSASQLASRNYICEGESSVYRPDEYGHCAPSNYNCDYISYRYTGDTTAEFFFDGYAPPPTACSDGIDNEGDGHVDLDDSDCHNDRGGDSEGSPPPVCSNKRDDDADGKVDRQDPGCKGESEGATEDDPEPVASKFRFTRIRVTRACRMDLTVEALPDLAPKKLFPFKKVVVTVRGLSGAGSNYTATRRLPLAADPRYGFRLKPGRYRVTGRYPGDRFRKPSRTSKRTVSVCL
jgi:hypothetical protein